ncbi:MAG: nucleotide sugar dehydrogenase [Bdellovibrionales bacterium]|nr:nucleotide sugar dehydrogenase [Bdellovibrionales bacterium]
MSLSEVRVAVIGLGYVGIPLALAFARKFEATVGFDIDTKKIEKLKKGIDPTDEGLESEIKSSTLHFTADASDLKLSNFYIVGVPTPVDVYNRPDLNPVISACKTVGAALKKNDVVVFESTVYPGVTEEICGPILSEISGLKCGVDFFLGYSPERINPGDKHHTLERITKIVSGQNKETAKLVSDVYSSIIEAGVYLAADIKTAEAAKVIENTQRDLNIALMNELSVIFNLIGIKTSDVIEAAGTKWNFLKFYPGLVGGHCIGVDPYYLTTKAEQLGYHPQVILAGRKINDEMGKYVARQSVKLLINSNRPVKGSKVGVLGVTFKENVTDTRNSRVPDIIKELREFGIDPLVHDPSACKDEVNHEYGIKLADLDSFNQLDCLILAVAHQEYQDMGIERFMEMLNPGSVFVDVKSIFKVQDMEKDIIYWSL